MAMAQETRFSSLITMIQTCLALQATLNLPINADLCLRTNTELEDPQVLATQIIVAILAIQICMILSKVSHTFKITNELLSSSE